MIVSVVGWLTGCLVGLCYRYSVCIIIIIGHVNVLLRSGLVVTLQQHSNDDHRHHGQNDDVDANV